MCVCFLIISSMLASVSVCVRARMHATCIHVRVANVSSDIQSTPLNIRVTLSTQGTLLATQVDPGKAIKICVYVNKLWEYIILIYYGIMFVNIVALHTWAPFWW